MKLVFLLEEESMKHFWMVYYQRYYLRMLVSLPSHMKENQIYRNLCLLNCEHGRNRE